MYNLIVYKRSSQDVRRNCVVESWGDAFDYSTHANIESIAKDLSAYLFANMNKDYAEASYGFLIYRFGKRCYDTILGDGITWDCSYDWEDYEKLERDELEARLAELDVKNILEIANNLANKRQEKLKAEEAEKKRLKEEKNKAEIERKERIQFEILQSKYGKPPVENHS
jgi:hypothetical protein